jgi:glycosyltransferase involved in cell wall biosynthesis
MKILFLTHKFYPEIGGIEVNSEILAGSFHDAGHEVTLVTWTEDTGNKTFPYPVVRKPTFMELLKLHLWAKVVFENNPCIRLSWPGIFFKRPLVTALRTWIARSNGESSWKDKLKILWLKRAKLIITVSKSVRDRHWPSATVIGNPYRYQLFRKLPHIHRTRSFVYLGRLVSDKGVALAIKAFYSLSNSKEFKGVSPGITLTIIGEGPQRHYLEELTKGLGLSDQVVFTGALKGESLVEQLNLHEYLIVPSVWEEPFGNVALEGMACGCLPIVSDGGGLPDAIGNAGLTFKSGDEESLVKTIKKILKDPVLEAQLRKNAVLHLKNHQPEKVSQEYLKVIERSIILSQ